MTKFKSRRAHPRIPLARDIASGHLIRAEYAQHLPPPGTYRCLDPRCGGDLTVYERPRGSGNHYFRHRVDATSVNCGLHSSHNRSPRRHEAAKHVLAEVFHEVVAHREPMPLLSVIVAGGRKDVAIFARPARVETEWTCPATRRRADIALLDRNGDPILLVEIYHSHAVDGNKRQDLSAYDWIEVEANEVLDDVDLLRVRHAGGLPYVLDPDTQQRPLPGMRKREW